MTLTLTLREPPAAPLEAAFLTPDRLAGLGRAEVERTGVRHGNRHATVGELFAVSGADGRELRLEGDLRRVAGLGAGMRGGCLTIVGPVGPRVGAGMTAGELTVEGDAGDWAGAQMCGGRLVVRGSAGAHLGGAWPGERAGMRGGEIAVHGDAGPQAGAGLRRGLVAVGGRVGDGAALRLRAGTLVALGGLGRHPGADMRRGTLVTMSAPMLLPTYRYACTYRPSFLVLLMHRLRALGLSVTDEQLSGRYTRWCGDGLELNRGEILVLEPAT